MSDVDSVQKLGIALEAAMEASFVSQDSRYGNDQNVVDVLEGLLYAVKEVAHSIRSSNTMAGEDATGGRVDSLLEAVMGITSGLVQVATAILYLADKSNE